MFVWCTTALIWIFVHFVPQISRICNQSIEILKENLSNTDGCHWLGRNCFPFLSTWDRHWFLVCSCCSIFSFLCSVLKIVVCPFVLFLLSIVLSVLRFTASDNPIGIFKLFLTRHRSRNYDTRVYWQTNNDIPAEENGQSYLSLIIMFSVYFFCNISSCDILAYITKNYITLIYYAKIVHLLCQFHAGKVGFSAVCQAIYS